MAFGNEIRCIRQHLHLDFGKMQNQVSADPPCSNIFFGQATQLLQANCIDWDPGLGDLEEMQNK